MRITAPLLLIVWCLTGVLVMLKAADPLRLKLTNHATKCPLERVLQMGRHDAHLGKLMNNLKDRLKVTAFDEKFGIERIESPEGPFWIQRKGERWGGKDLLAYLLGEHEWTAEYNPAEQVKPGDVVLDCGAHVGVFTHLALARGASKVIAIEPDTANLECLRRNLAKPIEDGRVVIVPKGVWSESKTLVFHEGRSNSGMNSLVVDQEAGDTKIPVVTIDSLVESLHLEKVSYIKMDIEGAEREALAGANQTLRRFRPRLMIDSYHLADDMEVLPKVIRSGNPGYEMSCGPCEYRGPEQIVPHVTYYR